jgi:hypothetical protein
MSVQGTSRSRDDSSRTLKLHEAGYRVDTFIWDGPGFKLTLRIVAESSTQLILRLCRVA